MALSGNQKTKIGGYGSQIAYAGFTAKALATIIDAYHAVYSAIQQNPSGILSTVTDAFSGQLSTMIDLHGERSKINSFGKGLTSTTTDTFNGIESEIAIEQTT